MVFLNPSFEMVLAIIFLSPVPLEPPRGKSPTRRQKSNNIHRKINNKFYPILYQKIEKMP